MRFPLFSRLFAISLLACFALIVACSDDPEPTVIIEEDVGADPDAGPGDDADNDEPEEGAYCAPCTVDEDCDGEGLCLSLAGGENVCGEPCELDGGDCPDDANCRVVDEDDNTQCVPAKLTCTDRCDDVVCASDEFCDPSSGECNAQARICDTGCSFDLDCGDPSEFSCLNTGAPDGETMCTTTCDPEATGEDSDLECPSDFFCARLAEDSDEGICYPFSRTCTDRCLGVDCPAGQNCNPVTGGCVAPTAGACQDTCEIDAECEGQDDICLNLGIGDGPHCWQDCTADGNCPNGYDCSSLLGLTQRLCLPPGQSCQECYDADCFPDGVCNPTSGECMPHPEDCTIEGCDDEQMCEPISKRCIDVDRSCGGDSWAIDCDNVITRCTTQRSGTAGVCATICFDDSDCTGDRSCTSTELGNLCLGPNLGGARACGTLTEENATIGQPCGDGADSCSGSTQCVESGSVPGFCSMGCTADADCPEAAACGVGPDGDSVCLPAQCHCAGDPSLADDLAGGLDAAFDDAGLNACDLVIPTDSLDEYGDFDDLAMNSGDLDMLLDHPVTAMGALRTHTAALDAAMAPGDLLAATGSLIGGPIADPIDASGGAPALIDALEDLATTAGGSLNSADATSELADVPADVQDLAAELVAAIDTAYQARDQAFSDAGIDTATAQTLFDETHRLLLPHLSTQDVLDTNDPDIADALANFPIDDLTQAGADLAATIDAAIDAANIDPASVTDEFLAVIDTPAGLVVIGDATNNVYDADANPDLDAPLALVLDVGGDNEYLLPVAANQSVSNAVSILVDLDGSDTYSYPKVGDSLDGTRLMESDDAGRRAPTSDDGPVSVSETARQGVGRLGIGMLFDRGTGQDSYETLRIGQGAAILGVGALFDQGTDSADFEAEAFAQGASLGGVALLYSAGGNNSYRLWQAGQGFGAGSGVGVLYDESGDDNYTAVTGTDDDDDILYYSPADGGNANRNLAQGAGAGSEDIAGGLGMLRDAAGHDTYLAASYAQGFGEDRGIGLLADADGDDDYQVRGYAQGTGLDAGVGVLIDTGGDDDFNQTSASQSFGQGAGLNLGWGAIIVEGGQNNIRYSTPGGALGFDGGMGFSLFDGGPNDHNNIGGGLGLAGFDAASTSPLAYGWTAAFFVQTGAQSDIYAHPLDDIGDNDDIWRQDDDDVDHAIGVGVDQ